MSWSPYGLNAGPTHLNTLEDLEEKVGIPGGLQASSLDALALDGLLTQEVEGNVAEHGDVLGRVAGPDAALVLVEGDIEDVVQLILDAPMAADGVPEGPSGEGMAEQVVAILNGPLGSDTTLPPD